ncbi:hypothetical protein CH252_19165 [Rhodococcus sp. 06-1477-1B]|nr:hypothetical protein CH252_19165 [Rhodococcus sp. 06-1477-1B]
MSAIDFEAWAVPPLTLTLNDHTYVVEPPDVLRATKLLAAAVQFEINLGIAAGPLPDSLAKVLETITADQHPALGEAVYAQMLKDKQPQQVIDRFAFFATFYWVSGQEYATKLAHDLWDRQGAGAGGGAPKD